jgi:hypothetical protein
MRTNEPHENRRTKIMAKVKKIVVELNADVIRWFADLDTDFGYTDDEIDSIIESIIDQVENKVIERIRSVYPEADYEVSHNHGHGVVSDNKINVVVEPDDDDLVPAQAMMELELETIEHLHVVIHNAYADVMNW